MRKQFLLTLGIIATVLIIATYFFATNYIFVNPSKQILKIHCATSLQFPLIDVETHFEEENPDVDVQIEGHGSIQVIRHTTELGQKIDVLFVADYGLIPIMMYNTTLPNSQESYANYYIRFATNTLVLAYTDSSRYASEINSDNWYSILLRPDVTLGFGNPQIASIGYRAVTSIQLAQKYYNVPRLFHDLITANLNPPWTSISEGSDYTIIVPEVQQPIGEKLKLRTSEVDLIALLNSEHLDYALIYLSNAKQYNLNYIELPEEINLGSENFKENYASVEVKFEHQRFSTISLDRSGETIFYGVTIPKTASNPELAQRFIDFILTGTGKEDFESAYHPIFSPAYTDNVAAIPEELKTLVVPEP
jgi:molybdate/tungstate transport system substrate-binding protein